MSLDPLVAISPLDGRYAEQLAPLREHFSEFALIRARVEVEVRWLMALASCEQIPELAPFSEQDAAFLRGLYEGFSLADARAVKELERRTNHDVKAVEYWLRAQLAERPSLASAREFVHFACTSEDINNLAYGMLLARAREQVLLPRLDAVRARVQEAAVRWAEAPMLARTHGQPATPTTMGKEWAVFAHRLARARKAIATAALCGKINGATGAFQAHCVAYPEVDWLALSRSFVESLGLVWNPLTTQIEPHDGLASLLDACARASNVLVDFARDVWGYISLGYFRQALCKEEVGSSTMPHKVNPIDFENAEGNLELARGLFRTLADKLTISRFQRDLSDSTVMRNLGVAFGHFVLALVSLARGIDKLALDPARLRKDLEENWEVLAEAVQTVMRRYGLPDPYEQLKALTRGRRITAQEMRAFIASLNLPDEAKQRLLALTPASYVGLAPQLARLGSGEDSAC